MDENLKEQVVAASSETAEETSVRVPFQRESPRTHLTSANHYLDDDDNPENDSLSPDKGTSTLGDIHGVVPDPPYGPRITPPDVPAVEVEEPVTPTAWPRGGVSTAATAAAPLATQVEVAAPGRRRGRAAATLRHRDALVEEILGHGRATYRAQLTWERAYIGWVLALDLVAGAVAAATAYGLRFETLVDAAGLGTAPASRFYLVVSAAFPVAWVVSMTWNRAYEPRFLGGGPDEFRRVINAAVRLTALVAVVSYATRAEIARAYLLILFPLATLLTLVGRAVARGLLHQRRRRGQCMHRVLVVGAGESAEALVRLTRRDPSAGWNVVGVCLDRAPGRHSYDRMEHAGFDLLGVPIVGTSEALENAIRLTDATMVAISPQMDGERLRRALWALEGSNVDVLVSSAVTDVTGPRIHLRPVAGLPLLHIEEPELTGTRRIMKGALDRGLALVMLTLISPLLLAVVVAVRLNSRGPAFFRQTRIGRDGRPFTMFKFRSMFRDAEARRAAMVHRNQHGEGPLFKDRDDPRITAVGRFLRKWSIDELPQLFNVLIGTMSLVGPRPPLPDEVAQYEDHVHRRLMVKPGLTGLWQVSGRSDLDWEESVRLDLRYVESWSLALDLAILWRTVFAVLKRQGAY
jgi:exopolysaccharide biosynthesis polyprenyl glycosylphosphotransferase